MYLFSTKKERKDEKMRYDLQIKEESSKEIQNLMISNSVYLSKNYKLAEKLKEKGLYNKYVLELVPVRWHKDWIKMHSIASSSRLCFLHFLNNSNIEYEHTLIISGSSIAHYDAFNKEESIYYECKCHEIFDEHEKLKCDPYRSLFKSIGYDNLSEDKNHVYLKPTFEEIDLQELGKRSIYSTHFDFKQLITHLFGMIVNKKKGTLYYLFFTPKNCSYDDKVTKLFIELREELRIISSSSFIKKMKNEYGISIEYKFLTIDEKYQIIF